MTTNKCATCEQVFINWVDYHTHNTGAKCVRTVKPLNTSGREPRQIVADAEASWLRPYIVGDAPTKSVVYKSIQRLEAEIKYALDERPVMESLFDMAIQDALSRQAA